MASYPAVQIVDSNGFPTTGAASTAAITAGQGTVVVKTGAGRLVKLLVTTAASTGVLTVYDNTAASGTVIAVVPASTAAGVLYDLQMPVANGITVSAPASCAAVTLSYS